MLEEDDTAEDRVPPTNVTEQDTSILVNFATAEYSNPDDLRNIVSTI